VLTRHARSGNRHATLAACAIPGFGLDDPIFLVSMTLSENRFPLFRIML
jgi:hypothetical protein